MSSSTCYAVVRKCNKVLEGSMNPLYCWNTVDCIRSENQDSCVACGVLIMFFSLLLLSDMLIALLIVFWLLISSCSETKRQPD